MLVWVRKRTDCILKEGENFWEEEKGKVQIEYVMIYRSDGEMVVKGMVFGGHRWGGYMVEQIVVATHELVGWRKDKFNNFRRNMDEIVKISSCFYFRSP